MLGRSKKDDRMHHIEHFHDLKFHTQKTIIVLLQEHI